MGHTRKRYPRNLPDIPARLPRRCSTCTDDCHARLREHVWCKPLDSSLRWNDGGGVVRAFRHARDFIILGCLVPDCCRQAGIDHSRHSGLPAAGRRRPESSDCNNSFPRSGNDHSWAIPANVIRVIYLTSQPAFLDAALPALMIVMLACASMYGVNHWIPAFAGMTAGALFGLFGMPGISLSWVTWTTPVIPA